MTTPDPGFVHRYVPARRADAPTLLLLHGTGGDETDLLPLGEGLAPGAGLLSPRGQVLEHGMPRFFRRLAEGVFDLGDLCFRTHELAGFVAVAAAVYGFDPRRVVAVGYSNGANIAASLLLTHPGVLCGAILFHAQVPLEPQEAPNLSGVPVFLTGGRADPLVRPVETERLAALLREAGADVTLHWQPNGHTLSPREVDEARRWLAAWMREEEL
jgi:phospholipase/carboxylesterase/glyoxalase family protein